MEKICGMYHLHSKYSKYNHGKVQMTLNGTFEIVTVDYTYYIRKASGKPFFRYQYPSYVLVDEVGEINVNKEQFYIIDYNASESRNPYLPTI
jgi:hypothetical protein